jgi:hypothetical protein
VPHAILPVAVVLNALLLVDILALAVAQAIQDITLVGALIGPGIGTLPSDLVLTEFSIVDGTILPLKDAAAPQKTKLELAFVLMAVLELARSVTVINFANL